MSSGASGVFLSTSQNCDLFSEILSNSLKLLNANQLPCVINQFIINITEF